MRFDDLPDHAQWFMNELLEKFLDAQGHPVTMSRDDAKRALIWLFENGKAVVVAHGTVGEPDCKYSIEVDEEFANE